MNEILFFFRLSPLAGAQFRYPLAASCDIIQPSPKLSGSSEARQGQSKDAPDLLSPPSETGKCGKIEQLTHTEKHFQHRETSHTRSQRETLRLSTYTQRSVADALRLKFFFFVCSLRVTGGSFTHVVRVHVERRTTRVLRVPVAC